MIHSHLQLIRYNCPFCLPCCLFFVWKVLCAKTARIVFCWCCWHYCSCSVMGSKTKFHRIQIKAVLSLFEKFLTLWVLNKMATVLQIFSNALLDWKHLNFSYRKIIEMCSLWYNWQLVSIGSGDGFAPTKQQATASSEPMTNSSSMWYDVKCFNGFTAIFLSIENCSDDQNISLW